MPDLQHISNEHRERRARVAPHNPQTQHIMRIVGPVIAKILEPTPSARAKKSDSIFAVANKPETQKHIVQHVTVKDTDKKTHRVSGERISIQKMVQSRFELNTEIQKKVLLKDLHKLITYTDETGHPVPGAPPLPDWGDVFLRFLAVIRRMYDQVENDANELYREVKQRTDQIQLLTDLVGNLNKVKGPVDWSTDATMKAKLDYAIDHCGLQWEKGKYTFGEDDKLLFKENVRDKKENMEKIDKLKQLRMQQLFHDSAEHLQFMSNVAKMRHDAASHLISNFKSG